MTGLRKKYFCVSLQSALYSVNGNVSVGNSKSNNAQHCNYWSYSKPVKSIYKHCTLASPTTTMMLSSNMVARRAGVVPAGARGATPVLPKRTLVIRRFREDDNQLENFTGQGMKSPKNPVTGKPLTPVSDPNKDGYQATQQIPQGRNASARVLDQLEAQPQGRSFGELQAFDGLAPEVINSRLAMLGCAVAAAFELFQGKDVFEQIKAYPLLTVATFVAFTVASWIPFLRGQSYNVKSGPFTPAAEVTNGRIAMVGFVGLILFEAYFKGPFFPHLF